MSGADEAGQGQPERAGLDSGPVLSEQFFVKVNDIIAAANRIEQRLDTHHAEMVLLHAFSRYSAHHYRTHAKVDDQVAREAFASYIARGVEELIISHLEQMVGPASAAADPSQTPATESGAE